MKDLRKCYSRLDDHLDDEQTEYWDESIKQLVNAKSR
jgi:hypothetical protein